MKLLQAMLRSGSKHQRINTDGNQCVTLFDVGFRGFRRNGEMPQWHSGGLASSGNTIHRADDDRVIDLTHLAEACGEVIGS